MTVFRFSVTDDHNPYVRELAVEAPDESEARRLACSWMFARRCAGLTLIERRGGS